MSNMHFAVAAILVGAPFVAPRAEACEPLPRSIEEMRFSVRNGDTVPTNLVLTGNGIDEDDGSSWWLVDGEASIRLTMTETSPLSTRFEPATPLAASTEYALRWSPTADPTAAADPANGPLVVTTAAGDDNDAPAVPPYLLATTLHTEAAPGFCEPNGELIAVRFDISAADVADIAAIAVLDADDETVAVSTVAQGVYLKFFEPLDSGARAYRLVVTDNAGNTSETEVTIDLDEPLEPGTEEPGTEEPDTEEPDTDEPAEAGCASTGPAGLSPLAALLLLLLLRRRTRP